MLGKPGGEKNHHNFEHQLDPIGGFHSHGATQNRWLIIENTIEMDDLGVPQFQTPIDVLIFSIFPRRIVNLYVMMTKRFWRHLMVAQGKNSGIMRPTTLCPMSSLIALQSH